MKLTIQKMVHTILIPTPKELKQWIECALVENKINPLSIEVNIRIVTSKTIQKLNQQYRKKNKPTNILSFNYPGYNDTSNTSLFLGDLIICASVVNQEAQKQKKDWKAHWAHIVVHGILHLLGYDHEKWSDAQRMEKKERKILNELNFKDY